MRKTFFVLLFFLFTASLSFGQTQFTIGIKGGLNFANFQINETKNSRLDGRTGYHAGAFVLFKKDKWAIQPELILSQQGSTLTINNTDFESNFNYVNIPVILKYYFVQSKNGGGINAQLGPQLGILSSARADVFDSTTFILNRDQDVKHDYKKSDVSLCLGAGWDSPFGLSIDLRYNLGLTRIEEQESAKNATKNQVFQVSVGFKLMKFGY
jgi:hypothetical protein